jgi:hypothetical protein
MRKHKDHVKVPGPSGIRPTRFFGQTEANPVGFLQSRANVRKHFHQLKAQMRRMKRPTEKFGRTVRVLHETKGWQSARIA